MKSLAEVARDQNKKGPAKPKVGLLLIPKDDEEGDPGELTAIDDLATALGIDEVKDRPGAAAALRDFVRICMSKSKAGAYDDEEGEGE